MERLLIHQSPPGLDSPAIAAVLPTVPNRRGQLCIRGYYQLGWSEIVVYDVFDEHGGHVRDLHVEYPPDHPFLPPGTRYVIGETC